MIRHLVLAALAAAAGVLAGAGPAAADLAPPPPFVTRPFPDAGVPDGARNALDALARAMRTNDEALARQVVDLRGWDANLVGGSGNPLASFFRQGVRKRWVPVPSWKDAAWIDAPAGQPRTALMVPAAIVQTEDGRESDAVHVLIVKVLDQWRVLGAGEDAAQVRALGERFVAAQDLAPPVPSK
ncbi:MAG: hypothetical protein U1F43_10400 [Myxococcota bacterium]